MWRVSRASRSKARKAPQLQRQAYQELYALTEQLLAKGRQLEQEVAAQLSRLAVLASPLSRLYQQLQEFVERTTHVLGYSRRRVLQGEPIANSEKLFSMFEPHTQLINRGKQPQPIQFGHNLLVIEDAVGFICHYHILDNSEIEEEIVVPQVQELKQRQAETRSASFDSGFHSPANQQELGDILEVVCIPLPGVQQAKRSTTGP